MKNRKKVTAKGIAAAAACAMLAASVPLPAPVQAADDPASDPQPLFYFDMESLADGQVINQVNGTAYDLGGNAGQLTSSVGDNGQALKFDGTNYIDLGTEFQPTNAYTMAGWVRQDSGATDGQAIFARAWSGNVSDQLAMMVKNGSVYHAFSVSNGGSNSNFKEFSTSSVMDTETWEHVAVTRDGSNVTVYVNGENIYSGTNFPSADFASSDKHMYIGMDCDGSGSLYSRHAFKGALDELRLYDTALTQEQIRELAYVEPAFEIAEASNGSLTVTVSGDETPGQEDFDLTFEIDGAETDVTITGYQFEASEKKAVFTFDPLENKQNADKTVTVRVAYKGVESETSFVLPAGENEGPAATDLSVTNMSEKLGTEPHVKGMLKAEYTFEDPDNDAEGDTKYQWYISDTADGEYTKLSGICTQTVILLDDYVGKYLKCEITPADVNGNKGEAVMTPATSAPVQATEGNPLTDWFHEAGFGLSHHFLSNYFNLSHVYTSPEEMWDRDAMTWDEFVGQFDAEAYAEQVNAIGAKYVIITLGQNSGSYCAPNDVYDKYMREAGFIKEGEKNPKTTSYENDLPMKMADALAKYGIKVMLYLPSNPPHSACWDETGDPNGYGYFSDYLVTKEVFDYTPGTDGVPSQRARKVLSEMVEWWSLHYGDKIAGWWFDGFYHSGAGSQLDMSLEYNVSTLANAAKAGNPYSIVTFNRGMGDARYQKVTEYTDYTAGECTGLDGYPVDGRWAAGTTDCQNFMFGPLGSRNNWSNGWGCSGINHQDVNEVVSFVDGALARDHVIGLDVKVNVFGQIDPDQYEQLEAVHEFQENQDGTEITLNKDSLTLESVGDRGIIKYSGIRMSDLDVEISDASVAELREGTGNTYDIVALKEGTATVTFSNAQNPDVKAVCEITVNGREPKEVYDDTADIFRYSEGWGALSGRPADDAGFHEYKDTVHYTRNDGATVTVTFNGTGFDLIGGYNTDQGRISIQVDEDEPVIIDTSVPNGGEKKAFGLNLYGRYDLPAGGHTVTFTKLDGQYMIFDGLRIYEEEAEEVSKTTLEYFLNKAKEHVANGDTEGLVESVQKLFEEAITEGDAVMADANATRDEVMNATIKLVKAIHALEMKAADKTDLEMAVELGDMIDLSKYVEEGQKEFTDALAAAKEVLSDGDAMQGDVDAAWDALVTAMENLRLKADKDALEDLLGEVEGLDLSRYTEESAAAFRTALASAQAVFADETLSEADQQKVDDAVAALREAKDGLVAKADGSGDGITGDNNNGADGSDGNTSGTDNGGNTSGTGNADQNNGNSNRGNSVNKAAKTGDPAPVMGLMALVLVSGTIALVVSRKRAR